MIPPPPVAVKMDRADPIAIERAWGGMWRGLQETAGRAITRSAVLSLLIFVPTPAQAVEIEELVARVALRHPCRVVLMTAGHALGPDEVAARASLVCRTSGGRQTCSELVSLEAGRAAEDRMALTALPLLIPDLPAALYWRAGHSFSHPVTERLQDSIDKLILDSARLQDPAEVIRRVVSHLDDPLFQPGIGDLNWGRLRHWRAMIAMFFDAPNTRPLLSEIDEVNIEHTPTGRVESRLLAGWLASRLGWGKTRVAATDAEASYPNGVVTRFLERGPSFEMAGGIVSVRMRGANSSSFEVHRDGERSVRVRAAFAAGAPMTRMAAFEGAGEGSLLAHELGRPGMNPVFAGTLRAAVDLL